MARAFPPGGKPNRRAAERRSIHARRRPSLALSRFGSVYKEIDTKTAWT
jgi:hypothetical protein